MQTWNSSRILVSVALVVGLVTHAQATIIDIGSLTRDTTGQIINDDLNNREWLGWDITRGYTYQQTLDRISYGGEWFGFNFAHNYDAQLFIDAMAGSNNGCTVINSNTCLSIMDSNVTENVVGENFYYSPFAYGVNYDHDYGIFLSDNGIGFEVGIIEVRSHYDSLMVNVHKTNEWGPIFDADLYNATNSTIPISWLLFRETPNIVPEPSSIVILIIGLLAMRLSRQSSQRSKANSN